MLNQQAKKRKKIVDYLFQGTTKKSHRTAHHQYGIEGIQFSTSMYRFSFDWYRFSTSMYQFSFDSYRFSFNWTRFSASVYQFSFDLIQFSTDVYRFSFDWIRFSAGMYRFSFDWIHFRMNMYRYTSVLNRYKPVLKVPDIILELIMEEPLKVKKKRSKQRAFGKNRHRYAGSKTRETLLNKRPIGVENCLDYPQIRKPMIQ